ncbi:uncharacterized protein KQ657_000617 [Scheffersomyces spartinae]|uniref:Uncharacterized protein n=1 Tax=Scheffersomyces spartinae TaxID=45513 RepID=A0A9P7V926_9ASCO|nr:uncharacterized protein KQ657_000617 [Scheffersomyces spartinae]KAG7193548.1 hypothetical protein KQ657_000617 [Scheffersomyces spartinae]
MLRFGLRRCLTSGVPARLPLVSVSRFASLSRTSYRCASSLKTPDGEELTPHLQRMAELQESVLKAPEVKELLKEFRDLMIKKGFNTEASPSLMQMVKLMADSEVRNHLGRIQEAFDKAGIKISPEDFKTFSKMWKM